MTRLLTDILDERAAHDPDGRVYTFLDDGERDGDTLTWGGLARRSRAVAAALARRLSPGSRVLLLFPPGLDFIPAFFGSLRARTIAVLTYPPAGSKSDRIVLRLRGMAADAGFGAVVAPAGLCAKKEALVAAAPALADAAWIDSDTLGEEETMAAAVSDGPRAEDVAFLQYTSGSTSKPRGVMVTHANLLHNLGASARLARHDSQSVGVSWLPVNHDMGLIDGILQPAFSGFPLWLMSPAAFLQRPARWLQAISRLRATHSGGPDFAYELCVRRIGASERAALDLGAWRTAFNGSEPVRSSTLHAFVRAFGECGFHWEAFRPAYGLAESTLLVTSSGQDEEPHVFHADADALRGGTAEAASQGRHATALVSSGRSAPETTVLIVDPVRRTRCAPGRVGEIWVRGASVAAGYWKAEAETTAAFRAFIADGEGPFLRTGDLGFLRGGHLFVTGRIKDMLIVRGVKHYPQDIEATIERTHALVRPHCAAAFNFDAGDRSAIAIAVEIETRGESTAPDESSLIQIAGSIAQAASAAHGFVPAAVTLLEPGALPRTTSGKIERYRCRELTAGGPGVLFTWSPDAAPPAAERVAS